MREIGPPDGLPSMEIFDIDQRTSGRMAFLTRSGLAEWDGGDWVLDDTYRPIIKGVYRMALGADGSTWLAGNRGRDGILHRAGGSWQRVAFPEEVADAQVTDLVLIPSGSAERPVVTTLENGVLRWNGRGWEHVVVERDGARPRIWNAVTRGREVLLATSLGLGRLDAEGLSWELDEHLVRPAGGELADTRPIYGLATDGPDRLWVVGRDWLGSLVGTVGLLRAEHLGVPTYPGPRYLPRIAHSNLFPAVADGTGGIWFAFDNFVRHFDPRTGQVVEAPLPDNPVSRGATDLFCDREGNLWRSTLRGLTLTTSPRFVVLGRDQGLVEDEVSAMVELPNGALVFGHYRGLSILEDGVVRQVDLPQKELTHDQRALELAVGPGGELWLARRFAGIMRILPDGQQQEFPLPEGGMASGILATSDGRILASTSQAVLRWDGERFTPMENPPPVDGLLRRLQQLPDGRLCALSSRGGLYIQDSAGWVQYRHPSSAEANNTYAALLSADGRVLVGTMDGLYVAEGGALTPPREVGLRIVAPIYSLLLDPRGRLWAGTSNGVARWNGTEVERFSVEHGIAGYEMNRAAALVDSRGQVWFGSVGGATCYRELYDRPGPPTVPLHLQALDVAGHATSPNAPLDLAHDEGDLTFSFHAVSFRYKGEVEYRCRLLGYDTEWLVGPVTRDGRVRYTHLPPGDYQFEVQARLPHGDWGETVRSVPVRVQLPLWRSAWFLALALVAGVVLLEISNRVLLQRRRARELERLVTERTAELRATEQRYRQIFEQSSAPQLLIDAATGRVSAANEAANKLYGYRGAEALIGMTLNQLDAGLDGEGVAALLTLGAGEGRRYTATHRVADGSVRELTVNASGYELEGRRLVEAILEDVTERRELHEQLLASQRMESVGLLAGGVAHDFNNILTVLMGNLELVMIQLELPNLSLNDVRARLQEMREAGDRAASLTSQLLAFSRRQVVQVERVDVGQVVAHMEGMIRRLIRADIELELELGSEIGETLVDPTQLEQVVMNLVVNASDAMPDGGRLQVTTTNVQLDEEHAAVRAGARTGDAVQLSVRDTGGGMEEHVRHRIFEPFFTTKPQGQGTGLGLSVIHGIVRQAEGAVEVDSEPGQGTEFRIYLPAADEPRRAEEAVDEPRAEIQGEETVLLVEDDDALRQLLFETFQINGYHVLGAATPGAALQQAAERPGAIDIVVTDVILPDMNGRELVRRLQETQPEARILFISGYTANVISPEGGLEEGLEFMAKPFTGKQLLRRVRSILDVRAGAAGGHASSSEGAAALAQSGE